MFKKIISLDTEFQGDELLSIGVCEYVNNKEVFKKNFFRKNFSCKLTEEIKELTKINSSDLQNGIGDCSLKKILEEILRFEEDKVLIGFDISKDLSKIQLLLNKDRLPLMADVIDLKTICCDIFAATTNYGRGLKANCKRFGISTEGEHNSLIDAEMTYQLFKKLEKILVGKTNLYINQIGKYSYEGANIDEIGIKDLRINYFVQHQDIAHSITGKRFFEKRFEKEIEIIFDYDSNFVFNENNISKKQMLSIFKKMKEYFYQQRKKLNSLYDQVSLNEEFSYFQQRIYKIATYAYGMQFSKRFLNKNDKALFLKKKTIDKIINIYMYAGYEAEEIEPILSIITNEEASRSKIEKKKIDYETSTN